MQRLDGQVNGTMQSLLKLGSAAAGVQAIKKGFEEGLQVIDDYKLSTIGIAATVTDMAAEGATDLEGFYDNAKNWAEDTYQEVELAAAKWFASGKEMVEAWKILTQKGTIVTSDKDIDNLGVIVDKIKLATAGQVASLQIAQELRAVMNGQARATDQIAMLLKDMIGPEWEDQLKQAREEGRVLEWLAEKFKGLKYASGDIQKSLESQRSTLGTLLSQVGRAGLAQAYDDIVSLVSDINEYLRTHKDLVANQIKGAWDSVKTVLFGVRDAIKEIGAWAEQHPIAAGWLVELAKVAAGVLAVAVVLRGLTATWKMVYALMAANLAYIGALFSPLVTWVSTLVAGLVAAGGPAAWLTAALVSLALTIAGVSLYNWISEWEVAGLAIKDWVDLGNAYLKEFFYYINSDFVGDVKDAISGMWDHFVDYLGEVLDKAWTRLKGFAADAWAFFKNSSETLEFGDSGASRMPTGPYRTPQPGDDEAAAARRAAEEAARAENLARIGYLLALRQYRKTGHYPGASPAAEEGKGSAGTPPDIRTRKASDDSASSSFSAARQLAAAELELAKATSQHKLELVELERDRVELAYRRQQTSAEEYYARLRELNESELQARLSGLEAEKAALIKAQADQVEAAKTPEQARAVQLKTQAKILDIEDRIARARSEAARNAEDLAEQERRALQDRASATARALSEILDQEQLGADRRMEIGNRLHDAQVAEIRAEALEIERKTEGRVKAEEVAAAKILEIQKDLRGRSIAELRRLLSDERSTLAERERAWAEIEERIEAGEVGLWDSFRFGVKRGLDDFKNAAQRINEAGRNLVSDLREGFSDFFSKPMKGEFESLGDAWQSLCDMMVDAFATAISDIMADMLASGLRSLFTGGGLSFLDTLFGSGGTRSFTSAGGASWSSGNNFLRHAAGDYWFTEPTWAVGLTTGRQHLIAENEAEYLVGGRSTLSGLSASPNTATQTGQPVQVSMPVHIHEAPGTRATAQQSRDADGNMQLDIVIEQVEGAIRNRMSRGKGLAGFFDSRYGRRYG